MTPSTVPRVASSSHPSADVDFVAHAESLLRSPMALERFAQLQARLRDMLHREGFATGEARTLGVLTCPDGHVGLHGEMTVTDPLWATSFVVVHRLYVRNMSLGGAKLYVHTGVANFEGPGTVTLSTSFLVSDLFRAESDEWEYLQGMLSSMGSEPFQDETEAFGWFANGLNDAMTP